MAHHHAPPENRPPNILVIMSDEHDPAVTGCYGDPVVSTPNLDRLAGHGVCFDNCYTTSPLCVPARLSFTAGKYISRVGAWANSCWLPSNDMPSLPRLLNEMGYESWLAGKMHYDATRRYGFRDLYPTPENLHTKTGRGARRRANDPTPNLKSWEKRSAEFRTAERSSVIDLDTDVTRQVRNFLYNRDDEQSPFFLLAGYLSPHFPLTVPESFYEKYADRVPMPDLPEDWFDKLPTNYQHLCYGFGFQETDPAVVKRGRELYWAFVEWMDGQIGQVLAALEDSRSADNTIVIYTTDHGENKGDHGLWWKNNMYEHSSRIPLIVSWPARWTGGQRRTEACSLVDLVQTIAAMAGAETPEDWDGDSMLPWLDDPTTAWKDLAVSEYYAHNIASGFAMLRQGRYKYVYHNRMDEAHGPERELYDLIADPAEQMNLAAQPNHRERVATLHAQLVEELGRDPEETERICRADYCRGYDR